MGISLLSSRIQTALYVISYALPVHGGHLQFITYADVGQLLSLLDPVAGPQKCEDNSEKCVAVLLTTRNITKPDWWPPSWIPARRRVGYVVGSCFIEILASKIMFLSRRIASTWLWRCNSLLAHDLVSRLMSSALLTTLYTRHYRGQT